MAINIEEDLGRMLEAIAINANYPCNTSLNILLEADFYFDVCRIIFPELNIKLIKLKENEGLPAGAKLQFLIEILSRELQIDLSSIKGEQILKGHLLHIHHFLQVLEKFSELHQENGNDMESLGDQSSRRVKSDEPNTSERIEKNVPRSAREKVKRNPHPGSEHGGEDKSSHKKKSSSKKKRPSSANKANKVRSHPTNIHGQLIEIMLNENKRALTASMRDNRKKKHTSILQAKDKYKSYLINHAKQERAAKNREKLQNKPRKQSRELPLEDYDNIENHFKNFSFKLREAKYRYLKRLEKTIRDQQMDRMCYNNRLMREQKQNQQQQVAKQLARIDNEHSIRNALLKEQAESGLHAEKLMKKEYSKHLRNQKKQLKETKKQELRKIKEFIEQENQKVLMNLEEGGSLERMIVDMYKRM